MPGEKETMDELEELADELWSFREEAHWFCPKRNDADDADYEHPEVSDDDISSEDKMKAIANGKNRHEVAYKYSLILGMDFEDVGSLVDRYRSRLNELLTMCDKCVHNWHLGRRNHIRQLSEQFEDEIVGELSHRLSILDFQRIDKGLESGQRLLATIDPAQRTQAVLIKQDQPALLALYEGLCCTEYHKDDQLLGKHFDYVFEQVQARKVLRIGDTLPAMARFLFSRNTVRSRFATVAWEKMKSPLTPELFDWVVHDNLAEALNLISHPTADANDVLRFWRGFLLLLDKMDAGLIRHSLRAMDVNIWTVALEHVGCSNSDVAQAVVDVIYCLLEKAPSDFWSALGTISAQMVADVIFHSKGFETLILSPQNLDSSGKSPALAWITPFLASLASDLQNDACHKLLDNLFSRMQSPSYPDAVKMAACYAGLEALDATLQRFVGPEFKINPGTSLIVISNIMGLVNTYKAVILACADSSSRGDSLRLRSVSMLVIKDALTLDCKAISAEFHFLENGTPVERGSRSHSKSIWKAVMDIFRPGNLELAKHILPATLTLVGLDELLPENKKQPEKLPEAHKQFNKDFHELMDNVARVFDRLSDFSATDLCQLTEETKTARPLFSALLSADQGIYEAAVGVIKSMTDQVGKQDAIHCLLETSFTPMLTSLTTAIGRVRSARTFGPIPNMIKLEREVLDALCGNTGILRTRSAWQTAEQNAIFHYWIMQWKTLDTIFSTTESWSPRVNQSTSFMMDFCRDSMEYAEALFNEYTIFASALVEASPDRDSQGSGTSKASLTQVLDIICRNVGGLVGMLRLRDAYLVSVITSLLGKLLRCLGEFDLAIDDAAISFIKDACKRENSPGWKRTNMTPQQKAELLRVLDDHQGLEIIEISKPIVKKQGTITAWSQSAEGKHHEPKVPQGGLMSTLNLASTSAKNRSIMDRAKTYGAVSSQAQEKAQDMFKEKRRRAEEEKAKAKAAAIAKARGLREGGSGLEGIGGVTGKDHAPERSEIMVGSSDEDSDDDDEGDPNPLVRKRKEASKMVTEYEESRRRALKAQQNGPVKKTKVQRSAKDLRARVEPNMDRLYLEILNWDIFHGSDTPPSKSECRKIDNRYLDLDLYKRTFMPLLTSEVWRSLVTAKDEDNNKPIEIKVLNRLSVDKFIEISSTMPMSANRDLKMSERDIVLLSKSSNPIHNKQEPHCLARVDRTTRKKDAVEVTFRLSREINSSFLQCLVPNGKIHGVKIADMTTTQREYAALSSLEYYDLCPEILEAKPSPLLKYPDDKLALMANKYKLNRGQSQAILSANDNDGFTLIQGPPGSGKTKTIVAMVGALLTQSLQQQATEQAKARPTPQGQKTASPIPKKKLLICAPSNAAVDELVVRLKEGVQPLSGPRQKINVIRIGRSDAINTSVKDVILDELVRKKLEGDNGAGNKLLAERDALHKDAAGIKERLNVIRPEMAEAHKAGNTAVALNLQREFDQLKRKQAQIGAKIDEDKQSGNTASRQNEINRRMYQQEIIDGAHVLCATLSGSGHDMFRNLNVEFETVIIDEAAQCIELSALIPLKYGCSKCILVGDPEQLPPTVLSRSAKNYGYEQSLFVRMQKNHPKDIHLLDTQYRMHPEISSFPSQQFYQGRLIDGEGMANLRIQPWHASTILGPYRFFDVEGTQTQHSQGHSFINIPELNAAIQLYQRLKEDYHGVDFRGKIGIITTYKAQLNELKSRFASRYGDSIFDEIEFNTTDAFQGREREIIIFSCVRAKPTGGIGFLSDIRRMNVGLTRAKSSLWVLGDSRSLHQGEFWNRLIEDAKSRGRYTGGNVQALLSRPTSRNAQPEIYVEKKRSAAAHTAPVKVEDEDTEMADASSAVSCSSSSSRHQSPPVKEERKQISNKSGIDEFNEHGKRPRSSSAKEEDDGDVKKAPKNSKALDLEAAFQAQEAAKPAPGTTRPPRPAGMMAPRRKAPADPFIQRKPARRK